MFTPQYYCSMLGMKELKHNVPKRTSKFNVNFGFDFRDLIRTLSNIYDGTFCQVVNGFHGVCRYFPE